MENTNFEQECIRKEQLMKLFEALEKENRRVHSAKKAKKRERAFKDWVKVTKIKHASLELKRGKGEKITPLLVTQEINSLIRKGDDLFLTAELRDNQWHVVFVEAIGSYLTENIG